MLRIKTQGDAREDKEEIEDLVDPIPQDLALACQPIKESQNEEDSVSSKSIQPADNKSPQPTSIKSPSLDSGLKRKQREVIGFLKKQV